MFAGIVALDHAVPPDIQTAEQLAPLIRRDAAWIRENAGVSRRHCCIPMDDPAVLVAPIARKILDRYGVPDLVIHAGAMTRQLIPDTAVFVGRELGLVGVPCFTVNATCLSFVVAMQVASSLIASGIHRRILICTSELGTPGRNFEEPESAALIGDACAAMLIEATLEQTGIVHYAMATWPEGADWSSVRGGGVVLPPHVASIADNLFQMNGEQLLRFVVPRLSKFLNTFLRDAGVDWNQIDHVIPHQASAAGMKLLARLGIPEQKTVNVLDEYGNCGAASIPLALSIACQQGRIRRGDQVLLLGTAAGVSIGAALVRW